jgi:large subunit ribosomal protein L13
VFQRRPPIAVTYAARHPERVIEIGVKGMLPKTPLGRAMFKKLKVYSGPTHPHTAQGPVPVTL